MKWSLLLAGRSAVGRGAAKAPGHEELTLWGQECGVGCRLASSGPCPIGLGLPALAALQSPWVAFMPALSEPQPLRAARFLGLGWPSASQVSLLCSQLRTSQLSGGFPAGRDNRIALLKPTR